MNPIKYILIIAILLLTVFFPVDSNRREFPEYRIVLDPGHGGLSLSPRELHGDRYDSISEKYLDSFREGASYKNLEEHAIVYSIALKAKRLLDLCSVDNNYKKFFRILARYTDKRPARIVIDSNLIRGDSRDSDEIKNRKDPNEEFRLFDFPDEGGNIKHGRISRINSLKPCLVVSLHLATSGPREYRGLNPVIVAPFNMLYKGLNYLRKESRDKTFFYRSRYSDWFSESIKRTDFDWFLKDVSVYFTGYSFTKNGMIDTEDFKGYRYNMVSWAYSDHWGWEYIAKRHPDETHFAKSFKNFKVTGKFWEREKSIYEGFRRDGGYIGYGGDNLYASSEIIRYILLSTYLKGKKRLRPEQKLTNPYISIWSLPIHINAISAYIELGYLKIRSHREMFTKKQNEIAEGIAVGIYSLLTGLKLKPFNIKYKPKGKRIDLKKYHITNDKSYFEIVSE